jgi:hypothetical protein
LLLTHKAFIVYNCHIFHAYILVVSKALNNAFKRFIPWLIVIRVINPQRRTSLEAKVL